MADSQDQLTCNGFSVWILVDGVKLNVHGVERMENKDGEDRVSCWIASEANKEFLICCCQNEEDACEYAAFYVLDGSSVAGRVNSKPGVNVFSGVRTSATEFGKCAFAPLELTDEEEYLADSSENIGEITIKMQRIKQKQLSDIPSYSTVPNSGKVHERSKKGLAHQVKYSTQTTAPSPQTVYTCEYHAGSTTFVFRYRPLAMLQATGVVPHIPVPPTQPSPSQESTSVSAESPPNKAIIKRKIPAVKEEHIDDERDLEEGENSEDDVREKEVLAELDRISRERELLTELGQIRSRQRAKKESKGPSKKKIKIEPKASFAPGEVIDLT